MRSVLILTLIVLSMSPVGFAAEGDGGERSTESLIAALKDENTDRRLDAVKALGSRGETQEAKRIAEALLIALRVESQVVVKRAVVSSIGHMGGEATGAVEDLVGALSVEDLRRRAVVALGRIGPAAKAAISPLANLLGDERVGSASATALGAIGLDASAALIEAMASKEATVRGRGARALGLVGAGLAESVGGDKAQAGALTAALLKSAADADASVRYEVVSALGHGFDRSESVVAALIAALDDADENVRYRASQSLRSFGEEAIAALKAALGSDKEHVRAGAVRALSGVSGDAVNEVVGDVAKLLGDAEATVRYHAAVTLKQLGGDAKDAAPQLAKALRDSDEYVRSQSEQALAEMGAEAAAALAVELKKSDMKLRALGIMKRLGADAKPAVAQLTELLADPDTDVRCDVIKLLTTIGPPDAKPAIEPLKKLLNDDNQRVKDAAKTALEKIDVKEKEEEK